MNFVNPWFLLGALATSIPVLLHLVKRERAEKLEFPTLMFLRRISKKTIRYQKIRNLLLLLLRVLALLLLVAAFMRPFRQLPQSAAAAAGLAKIHVVLLDNSMSMGYGDRWGRAKSAALAIARNAGAGDKVGLLEFSDRTSVLVQPTTEASAVEEQIRNGVTLSDQPTRYAQALRVAEKIALDAGTGKRVVHLISDFQKNGLVAEDQGFRFGPGIELQQVDVGSDDYSNLTIREVQVSDAEQNAVGLKLKSSLINLGTQDRKGVRVSLSVDSRVVAEKRMDTYKGASQGLEFQLPGLTAGTHAVTIELDDPLLTRDNRYNMVLQAREKRTVLSVEDAGSGRDSRSPGFFLARALNISSLSPYALIAVEPQKLESTGLTGGLVIWNSASLAGMVARKLQDFVKGGGGLIIVAPDPTIGADFNRSFGSWVPVKIEDSQATARRNLRPGEDYVLLTDLHMDHPVFRPFAEPHSGSFSTARFYKHARLAADTSAEVIARFDNGDPALVAAKIGNGRVLVFASSADDAGNDLPLKAVYAPFWQQMLRYLDNFKEGKHALEVGETISPKEQVVEAGVQQGKNNVDLSQPIVVIDPDKRRVTTSSSAESVMLERAGFYEIRTSSLNSTVAVNTVARESDLTHGNAEEMAAAWASSGGATDGEVADDERISPEEQDHRQRLWRFLLFATLCIMLTEALFANYSVVRS